MHSVRKRLSDKSLIKNILTFVNGEVKVVLGRTMDGGYKEGIDLFDINNQRTFERTNNNKIKS